MADFKGLMAFVQNLESVVNNLSFLYFLEVKRFFRKNHGRFGRGLGGRRRQKKKTKQTI